MQEPSSDLVSAYATAQTHILLTRQDDVRRNGPDAVHATRVACRRLRSTLRTYASLWERSHRGLLRDLRWYGRLLGVPRDTEVLEEGLLDHLEKIDAPGHTELADRLRTRLDDDRDTGLERLYEGMDTKRFGRLMRRVEKLADDELTPLAELPASRLLPALAYGPVLRVARDAELLPESGEERYVALHELRKGAKAARYAYEAIGPTGAQEAAAWKRVTESFGKVQDAEVAAGLMDELRELAEQAGEQTEAYGALAARLDDQLVTGEREGLDALAQAVAEAP